MIFDSLRDRMGRHDRLTPMAIAHNSLFTAKEKIELLNQLKSDATAAGEDGKALGFDGNEIDQAIAAVRQGVQDGIGGDAVTKGDI